MDEELQKIVENMIKSGESEDNIALVIREHNLKKKDLTLQKVGSTLASGESELESGEIKEPVVSAAVKGFEVVGDEEFNLEYDPNNLDDHIDISQHRRYNQLLKLDIDQKRAQEEEFINSNPAFISDPTGGLGQAHELKQQEYSRALRLGDDILSKAMSHNRKVSVKKALGEMLRDKDITSLSNRYAPTYNELLEGEIVRVDPGSSGDILGDAADVTMKNPTNDEILFNISASSKINDSDRSLMDVLLAKEGVESNTSKEEIEDVLKHFQEGRIKEEGINRRSAIYDQVRTEAEETGVDRSILANQKFRQVVSSVLSDNDIKIMDARIKIEEVETDLNTMISEGKKGTPEYTKKYNALLKAQLALKKVVPHSWFDSDGNVVDREEDADQEVTQKANAYTAKLQTIYDANDKGKLFDEFWDLFSRKEFIDSQEGKTVFEGVKLPGAGRSPDLTYKFNALAKFLATQRDPSKVEQSLMDTFIDEFSKAVGSERGVIQTPQEDVQDLLPSLQRTNTIRESDIERAKGTTGEEIATMSAHLLETLGEFALIEIGTAGLGIEAALARASSKMRGAVKGWETEEFINKTIDVIDKVTPYLIEEGKFQLAGITPGAGAAELGAEKLIANSKLNNWLGKKLGVFGNLLLKVPVKGAAIGTVETIGSAVSGDIDLANMSEDDKKELVANYAMGLLFGLVKRGRFEGKTRFEQELLSIEFADRMTQQAQEVIKQSENIEEDAGKIKEETKGGEEGVPKKADIERRRQEELKARVVYDKKPTIEDGEFKVVGDATNRTYRINENTGRPQVLDESNGLWSNTEMSPNLFFESTKRSGFEKSKKQINAKYDAELAALEQPLTPKKSGVFYKALESTKKLAKEYKEKLGITTSEGSNIEKIDETEAKRRAKAYEEMKHEPNNPEVKRAYEKMASETLDQYKVISDSGVTFELWEGEGEPYTNSKEMIEDVDKNKHLYILSTSKEFGNKPITDKQRSENPLLQDSGVKDKNGKPLLVNDVFRGVHDFFGHTERGNSFGAIGEENAWDVHARMYTPEARRAMTTETRGQNSWVNFSGVNDEANAKFKEARKLEKEGNTKEANKLREEGRKLMQFAPQKIGLLPEEFSEITEEQKGKSEEKVKPIRTPDVEVKGAPKGSFINVGMVEGKTKTQLTEEQITQALPEGVKVVRSKKIEPDSKLVEEPTLSMELSRPLTDEEMTQFREATKQLAIPQLTEGKGAMHGTLEWGDFNPEFFITPEGKKLSEAQIEPVTKKKPPTKIQKDIEKEVSKEPEGEKVVVDSWKEFKRGLKQREKAFKAGKIAGKRDVGTMRQQLSDFVSDNSKDINKLGAKLSSTILKKVNEFKTQKGMESTIKYIEDVLTKQKFRNEVIAQGKLVDKIRKEISPKKFVKAEAGVKKGKAITAEDQQTIQDINNIIDMDPVEAGAKKDALLAEIENRDGDITVDEAYQISLYDMAGIETKSSGELQNILNDIKGMIKTSKEARKKADAEYHKKLKENKAEAITRITKGKGVTGKLGIQEKPKSYFERLWDKSVHFLNQNEAWRGIIEQIDRSKDTRPLFNMLVDPIYKSRQEYNKGLNSSIGSLQKKKAEIWGSEKEARKQSRENSKMKPLEVTLDDGSKETIDISKNQAAYLYNIFKDESMTPTLDEMGYTDNHKKAISKLVESDEKLMEYADWMIDEFFPKQFIPVNEVYKRLFKINMPFIYMYMPISREGIEIEPINPLSPVNNAASIMNGSTKLRRKNTRPIKVQDIDSVAMQYITNMEYFKAFGESTRDISRILNDSEVRKAITQNNPEKMHNIITVALDDIIRNGVDNGKKIAAIDRFRVAMTTATLGVNPVVMIKQLTSAPAYASNTNTLQYSAEFMNTWGRPMSKSTLDAIKFISDSEFMKTRYQKGFDRDMADAMKRDAHQTIGGKQNFASQMMFMTKWGDKGAIILGGVPLYKVELKNALKEGMSKSAAKEQALVKFIEATKEAQQSTEIEDMSTFQRGGSFAKLFTMYKTSPRQYFAHTRSSLRNIARGRGTTRDLKRIMMYNVTLPALFAWVAGGMWDFTDDEEWEKNYLDVVKSIATTDVSGVLLIGDFAQSAFDQVIMSRPWQLSIPTYAKVQKGIKNITKLKKKIAGEYKDSKDNEVTMEDWFNAFAFPVEATTGLPAEGIKKLTYDNYQRATTGDYDNWKNFIGYSEWVTAKDTDKPKSKSKPKRKTGTRGRSSRSYKSR